MGAEGRRMAALWRCTCSKMQDKKRNTNKYMCERGLKGGMYIRACTLCLCRFLCHSCLYIFHGGLSLLSWNSDREQTTWCNQNLRNWHRWRHRACLPAENIPDKSVCSGDVQNEFFICVFPSISKTAQHNTKWFIILNIRMEKVLASQNNKQHNVSSFRVWC